MSINLCSACKNETNFKLCAHGSCASCIISGKCDGCEADAAAGLKAERQAMSITIQLPVPATFAPRTHIAAKVACDYVSFYLRNLPASAYTDLMRDGQLTGEVEAEYVGLVKFTITADAAVVTV